MTFDKPEHQVIVMKVLDESMFPGKMSEIVLELRQVVAEATINRPTEQSTERPDGDGAQ